MGRWSFTSSETMTIEVDGERIRLRAGVPYITDDPCEITALIAAWQERRVALGKDSTFTENVEGAYHRAREACLGQYIDMINDAFSAEGLLPGPGPDPSGLDGAPPPDGDTPETMGAPDPDPGGALEAGATNRDNPAATPGQRYHDRTNPQSEGEIAAAAADRGLPPDDVAAEVERARRNDPEPGQPHPDFSRNMRESLDATADPVAIFSGQFTLDLVDVEIASPGMPLRLERHYRSGSVYYGPWGFQWDHNYNVYLRPLTDGKIAVWTGRLREDLFTPNAAGGFDPPFGLFRTLEHRGATPAQPERWIIRERGGREFVFERPVGWPEPQRVPLVLIEDRNGNRHSLTYTSEGRLERVSDELGRFIRFLYGTHGLLEQVADHTGRTWRYGYHPEIEHLIRVVSPATDEYPEGRATCYEYDERNPHPALRHNLTAIVDPDGRLVVYNTYGQDPGTDDFGRVIRQDFGGFVSLFSAERLQYVPRTPDAINVPALRVSTIDPGILFIYTFNSRGDLLDKRFRLANDGSYRLIAEKFRYDDQGNLVEHYLADGRGMVYEYDRANPDPRARGNLLTAVAVASPLKPAPSIEVFRATYEPRYWQLKTFRQAGGAVTEFIYDYEASPDGQGVGDLLELRRPLCTQPDGTTFTPVERFAYNPRGQILRHEENGAVHEFIYATAGPGAGYLMEKRTTKDGHTVTESYERDALGNIRTRIDGTGNRSAYEMDAFNLVREKQMPDGAVWRFGYDGMGRLRHVFEPRGDYDDPVLAGAAIRHDFFYGPTGALTEEVFAANTAEPRRFTYRRTPEGKIEDQTDPAGRRIRRKFDERGLTLEEVTHEPDGTVLQVRRFAYERTGELRRVQVLDGPTVELDYDGFGWLRQATDPDGTRVRYERNRLGLPTLVEVVGRSGGAGSPDGLLARQRLDYNEVGALVRRTDVLFDNPTGPFHDLVTEFWRDAGQLITRVRNPNGLEETYTYTGTRAVASVMDSLGNQTRWLHDAAGRSIATETREADTTGSLAAFTETVLYDAPGRVREERDPLGNSVQYEYDQRGLLRRALNPTGSTLVFSYNAHRDLVAQTLDGHTIRWARDAAGRAQTVADPTGAVTAFAYDVLGRLRRVTRPDGLMQLYEYRPDGALARFVDYDGTSVTYTSTPSGMPVELLPAPAAGVAPTNPVRYEYDGLRRLVRADDGTAVITRRYDSLGRLLEEKAAGDVRLTYTPEGLEQRLTYPDGRRDLRRFDVLGRLREVRLEAAGSLPLAGHGLAPGATLATFDWAGRHRPGGGSVAGSLTSSLTYDDAARLVDLRWSDAGAGTVFRQSLFRDALGLVRAERRAGGAVTELATKVDSLARLARVKFDLPPGSLPATAAGLSQAELDAAIQGALLQPAQRTSEFLWTPGDAPAQRNERSAGGSVTATRLYTTNPLHQITAIDGLPVAWDARGNVTGYGSRTYRYDAFRRLVAVDDSGGPLAWFRYDALGRLSETGGGGGSFRYAYLGNELIETTAGAVVAQYTPGVRPDQAALVHLPGASLALVTDAAGSLMACCNLAGAVLERYSYDIFGEPRILAADGVTVLSASAAGLQPRFHGRPWLAAVGLYDFRTRVLHPHFLGFLQPDPLAFSGSWNPYGYARYNPFNFTDPDGLWITIVAGAVIGAAIGGIGAALSGGDAWDVLAGIGAGAVVGALTGAGMPVAGAAVAGGMMGAWSGGRVGYREGGIEGAVGGALVGGVIGAGLGVATGYVGSRVGNAVGTRVYGAVFNYARSRGLSGATTAMTARVSSMVAGGYTGGASAGIFGNTTATVAVDVVTGEEVTLDQIQGAVWHGIAVDGPLGAVGATADRMVLVASIPGRTNLSWRTRPGLGRNLGVEGEVLVGRAVGRSPAAGSEQVQINGRRRYPDFPTSETIPEANVVIEVKNKAQLSTGSRPRSDVSQIQDFADLAAQTGGNVLLYHRPGMDLTPVAGIGNLVPLPIPQQPFVLPIPHAIPARTRTGEETK